MPKQSELKDRLLARRKALGLRQLDLATMIGKSRNSVSQWEAGQHIPSGDAIAALAKALQCNAFWLVTGREGDEPLASVAPIHNTARSVPLISDESVAMLSAALADPAKIVRFLQAPIDTGLNAFAMEVRGDSMLNPHGAPSMPAGTVVTVDPDIDPEDGDFVVAVPAPGQRGVLKRFVEDGPNRMLVSLNPAYPPIAMTKQTRIVGTVTRYELTLRHGR